MNAQPLLLFALPGPLRPPQAHQLVTWYREPSGPTTLTKGGKDEEKQPPTTPVRDSKKFDALKVNICWYPLPLYLPTYLSL